MKISSYLKIRYLNEAEYIQAMWITPKGNVIDIGRSSHINFVIENPKKFGLTDDDVKVTRYGQVLPTGKQGVTTYTDGIKDEDWENTINKVLRSGFIRVRKVKTSKYSYVWYLDMYEFNRRTRKTLSDMAYSMDKNKDDKVIISVSKGDKPNNIKTILDLSGLSEEHEPLQIITLSEMEDLCL